MMHLSRNIVFIRKLSGLTQPKFAELMSKDRGKKYTSSMIKSYEGGVAQPDLLFLTRLTLLSGVSEYDLKNKELGEGDVSIRREALSLDISGVQNVHTNIEVVNEDGLGKKAKTAVNSGKSADNILDEERIAVVLEALHSEIQSKYNRFAEEIIESADKILRSHTDKPAVVGRKRK